MFRYLQYFIIILITSGISANYTHMLNHNKLRNLEREIEIQSKKNKERSVPLTMEEALESMYESSVFILKRVNNETKEEMDPELVDEIKLSCKQVLNILEDEGGLKLEVSSSDDSSFENLDS